jgi:hypothetical protein
MSNSVRAAKKETDVSGNAVRLAASEGAVSLDALDAEILSLMWRDGDGWWVCSCCDKRSKAWTGKAHQN